MKADFRTQYRRSGLKLQSASSLDVGKTANVVIANGDPLDVKTDVKYVFIQGKSIPMVDRQTELRDRYSNKQ